MLPFIKSYEKRGVKLLSGTWEVKWRVICLSQPQVKVNLAS